MLAKNLGRSRVEHVLRWSLEVIQVMDGRHDALRGVLELQFLIYTHKY